MLPIWADILVLAALPVILGAVLWIWGEEHADNTTVHESGGDEEPGEMAAVA